MRMARIFLRWVVVLAFMMPTFVVVAQSDSIAFDSIDPSAIAEDDYIGEEPPEGLADGKRNPIYYFGHDFSTMFFELSGLTGVNDAAVGCNLAYVPEVWGGYAAFHEGLHYHWVAVGAEYRLSSPWNVSDWHLYGGVVAGPGHRYEGVRASDIWGAEVGVRLAANRFVNYGKFAVFSGSLGLRVMNGGFYITGGFSLGLAAAATVLWLVF